MAGRRSLQCITLEAVFARTSVDGAKTQRVAFLADLFFIVFLAAFFPAAAFRVGLLILLAGRFFAPVLAAVFFPFLAAVVMALPALVFLAEVVTRLTALGRGFGQGGAAIHHHINDLVRERRSSSALVCVGCGLPGFFVIHESLLWVAP